MRKRRRSAEEIPDLCGKRTGQLFMFGRVHVQAVDRGGGGSLCRVEESAAPALSNVLVVRRELAGVFLRAFKAEERTEHRIHGDVADEDGRDKKDLRLRLGGEKGGADFPHQSFGSACHRQRNGRKRNLQIVRAEHQSPGRRGGARAGKEPGTAVRSCLRRRDIRAPLCGRKGPPPGFHSRPRADRRGCLSSAGRAAGASRRSDCGRRCSNRRSKECVS